MLCGYSFSCILNDLDGLLYFCEFKSVREKSWEKAELRKAEKTMSVIIENKDDIARIVAKVLFDEVQKTNRQDNKKPVSPDRYN